jgi:hypothetical protein
MFIAVARDLSLDLTLEYEARTILIIVGIAVGVLIFATAAILQADRFRKFGRYIFGIPSPIPNQAELEVRICIPLVAAFFSHPLFFSLLPRSPRRPQELKPPQQCYSPALFLAHHTSNTRRDRIKRDG